MTNLELFNLWSQLAPDECKAKTDIDGKWGNKFIVSSTEYEQNGKHWRGINTNPTPIQLAHLVPVLIQNCGDRGWELSLQNEKGLWLVTMTKHGEGQLRHTGYHSLCAIAILEAYVNALER
ncbi:hypothetical protein WA1_18740 [Scytonema hofmannii PCC 7110]|uniref:Phage ABA sandwich domain-containing protein n=1 Tax=Scytonema hofmannii PCC 7110 TaxID=128403 RepID=A0A139XBG0_9CYAN|nr:hypothetical protein [Scytonema hofmannii]KYC42040.1 hypothetical protein WA1_18740 [Scytonema hofmannii PCC 7110]